jgi:hypothetical protein
MLLTADTHYTDLPQDEYRWLVFEEIERYFTEHDKDDELYILGDLTDRRDRHSADLVNRLIAELRRITAMGVHIRILRGNHDTPLRGKAYWEWLRAIPKIDYIDKPTALGDLLLLPSSANPLKDWDGIPFSRYRALFMHQTVNGAYLGNGVKANISNLPMLPRSLKIYSGDLHVPHMIRNVVYVGAPHPKNFGDDHECRMLALDDGYDIAQSIKLRPPQKLVIEIANLTELRDISARKGDQARIRFRIDPGRLEQWPADREELAAWAASKGLTIASLEGSVETIPSHKMESDAKLSAKPKDVLHAFADAEGLDDDLRDAGLELLEEVEHA